MMHLETLFDQALQLLSTLIATPSFSRAEERTAAVLTKFFSDLQIPSQRLVNNVWVRSKHWHVDAPIILLNSHHDTVKPVRGWTKDPFNPEISAGKLYGLGSNDAGGALVALIATFLHFYDRSDLPFNLILAATAEEEVSGDKGIALLLPELGRIDFGIVGEPTQMRMAIAEKGLMVIDGTAIGRAGHAARDEGVNALYIALDDIKRIRQYRFEKGSGLLGSTKATVTQINAGTQHNVVPDQCTFVIDVRTNERYSNEEVFSLLSDLTQSRLKARSFRLNSSRIDLEHPLVQGGIAMGLDYYGSPTLSDQALINAFPTLKMGCGKSERSHTANEFILVQEIKDGIETYIRLFNGLKSL